MHGELYAPRKRPDESAGQVPATLDALGRMHPATAATLIVTTTGLTVLGVAGVVALVMATITAIVAVAGALAVALVAAAVVAASVNRS